VKADRRGFLKAGALAFALPGLPVLAGIQQVSTARSPGVGELWGMAFWAADGGDGVPVSKTAGRAALTHLPQWHPEFA